MLDDPNWDLTNSALAALSSIRDWDFTVLMAGFFTASGLVYLAWRNWRNR